MNGRLFRSLVGPVILGILTPLYFANANVIEAFAERAVGRIFYFVGYLFSFVGSILFAIAAFFTRVALNLNFQIFNDANQLIIIGWRIVRDIANLGFVLVIILIAVAIILRYETYGNKKLLIRLIGAAILVNFSLTIAGVFVDFSHVLTSFFLQKTADSPLQLADSLAGAFNSQGLLDTGELRVAQDSNILETTIVGFASLVFIVVFTLTASFAMLALALMFLLRYLWLTFLLIIAPIVWLFWVIPALEGQWNKWWQKFFQWVFFAPAASFFVYLALLSTRALSFQNVIYEDPVGKGFFGDLASTFFNVASKGAQMVVLTGILLGGLIVSQKMGITGAAGAIALGKKFRAAGLHYAGQRGMQAGGAALRTRPGQALTGGLQRLGQGLRNIGAPTGGRFRRIVTAPFRGIARGTGGLLHGTGTAAAGFATTAPGAPGVAGAPGVPAPSLWGSLSKHVFGQKQWVCNADGTVVGPSKRPPNKCPTPTCPSNIPNSGVSLSWRTL